MACSRFDAANMPQPQYELLDSRRHRDIRIGSGLAADLATLQHVQIALAEVADMACDYPLVFLKDRDTGQFRLVALLGLVSGCNAYIQGGQWRATVLPGQVARAPFALSRTAAGELGVAIDMAHPRSGDPTGQPLYQADGRETSFLAAVRARLAAAHANNDATLALLDMLVRQMLLQPVILDVDVANAGPNQRLDGCYTIDDTALRGLPDATVLTLHRSGDLALLNVIRHSLGQLHRLQQLHNFGALHEPERPVIKRVTIGVTDR